MTSKDLIFHLLDSSVRDVLIEEETEVSKKYVYEPVEEDQDEDSDGNKRRRRYNAAEKKEFIIHLFGCTADGIQVRVDVEGFRPTLYLRLPETKTLAAIDTLRAYMAAQGVPLSQVTLKQVQRKQFYGFTAETLYPFLEITVPSLALMRTVKNLFLDGDSQPKTRKALGEPFKRGHKVEVYEANLDPMLRFFHVQTINPCGWVQIKDIDMEEAKQPDGSLILTAHYTDILPATPPQPSAPFKRVSWDIECYSRTGDFPVAKKEWSKVAEYVMKNMSSMIPIRTTVQTLFDSGGIGQLKPKKTLKQLDNKLKGAAFDTTPTTQEECATLLKGQLGDILSIGDPVIQIGASIVKGEALEKHLFVWPSCDAIDEIEVHSYVNEKAMIEAWFEWLVSINPDILIGYNVFGFDERYLWQRAEDLGCTGSAQGLTRVPESEVVCEEKRLSSSAMGDNFLYMWTTLGRLQIDLFHYIKRNNASLPSYKLDEVTKYYLSGKLKKATKLADGRLSLTLSGAVKDLRVGRAMCLLEHTGEDLTDKMVIEEVDGPTVTVAWPLREDGEVLEEADLGEAAKWVVVKDDVSPADIFRLHKGTAADRAKVGKYCLQDCDLVLELYKNLEVFNNSMSMANVCCVPIGYIFTRGQGIKAESLMFRACRERGVLIPVLPRPGQGATEDSYEGAIVFDPVPGFYRKSPIGVADFASLYPSSIESENISHDSLVWVKDYDASGALIGIVWGSDEFDGRNGYGYTDIEFDRFRVPEEDKRKHPEKVKAGLRVCRFAQPLDGSKATVPEIIRGLLAARKAKRKEKAKETDPGRQALLEAEQLAYKLTANSLYGQLGSGTFKVRLQHLAASITAYGRKQIMFAKEVIDHFYGPDAKDPRCVANVMYGDTDSLFIEFVVKNPTSGEPLVGREARQAVIDLTAEAGKLVTKALAPPHDFEFDKVFDPMLMFSKKRYAGHMFEENADDYVTKYMGIALKRRDNAPIVKTIYGAAMKKLLLDRDIAGSTAYVQQACMDLVEGKVKMGQLTITKSLRAEYANPIQIAHKVLADRMAERDPGNAPASGDRIPFVYVKPPIGSTVAKLQGDRIEAPSYIKAHGLIPDYEFYLGHQIQNPVSQMFGLVLEEMPGAETIPWSKAPKDNPDKLLLWREEMAGHLLFDKAFQACGKQNKAAFVTTFFGLSTTPSVSVSKPTISMNKPTNISVTKKPTQTALSNFMVDTYLIKNINKVQSAKARAKAKAKEEACAGETKPKNEIIQVK
jgi:DNA polymerase elongation subunit (family B)